MKRILVAVLACVGLAACTVPTPRGEQVPVRQLLALSQSQALPFICSNYDAASDTCEGIGTFRVRGDRIYHTYDLAVSLRGAVIPLRVTGQEVIRGADTCSVPGTFKSRVQVPQMPRQMAEVVEGIFDAGFQQSGNHCQSFYRGPDSNFVAVVRDETGRPQSSFDSTFRYLSTRKRLRVIQP